MPERYLLGYVLPTPISLLMQGIAEGATIALLGLFVGDRLIEPHSRKSGIAFLLLLCVGILLREWQAAPTGAEAVVYSRRNLLTVASLLFLGVVATFNIAFYIRNPAHRIRMRGMGGVILVIAGLWTPAQVLTGARWIALTGPSPESLVQAGWVTALAALTYSILVEISLLLVTLYTVPAALGLIRSAGPDHSD